MDQPLRQTPLHALHQALGAKLVPFADFELPLYYPSGIRREHLHCRKAASLFDVSHMGQLELSYNSANCDVLERVIPADLRHLPQGVQRYSLLLSEDGSILDDLIISHNGRVFTLVVNAACRSHDLAYLRQHLPRDSGLRFRDDRALLALQGPKASEQLESLAPGCSKLTFMQRAGFEWQGVELEIGRSGYTGEDGFEISLPHSRAEALALALLDRSEVMAAGLGARDSLRLEAGLCLYGKDLDRSRTPVSAGLGFCIGKRRRTIANDPNPFFGAQRILAEFEQPPVQQRVGLLFLGKGLAQQGAVIVNDKEQVIGKITSAGYSFSRQQAIAMGYLDNHHEGPLFSPKRGELQLLERAALPFVFGKKAS